MKLRPGFPWKVVAALAVFLAAMMYNLSVRPATRLEGFDAVADMISNIQKASGQLGASQMYDQWVGYIYANMSSSGAALDDFKRRIFQPSCSFRANWATVLPEGLGRPLGANKADLANTAYKGFLDGLAKGDNDCLAKLDDFKRRFMTDTCSFLNPDPKTYNANYVPVFK